MKKFGDFRGFRWINEEIWYITYLQPLKFDMEPGGFP